MVTVDVEYCDSWGYGGRYEELAKVIKAKVPDAVVNGIVGRKTSFEVKIDGKTVHSKLETMAFPDYEEVATIASEVAGGGEARTVTQTESSCTIL